MARENLKTPHKGVTSLVNPANHGGVFEGKNTRGLEGRPRKGKIVSQNRVGKKKTDAGGCNKGGRA